MITRHFSRRVTRIEKTLRPTDDGMVTIEEFCRFSGGATRPTAWNIPGNPVTGYFVITFPYFRQKMRDATVRSCRDCGDENERICSATRSA